MKRAALFGIPSSEYGGKFRRKNRGFRPLSSRATLHLILKSDQATGALSFNHRRNRPIVERLLAKFAARFGVRILSAGIVTNHVHLHLRLPGRELYRRFIRALSSALAMAVTGHSRWNPVLKRPFFDTQPFSRIVAAGKRAFQRMEEYTSINHWEGLGIAREEAEEFVRRAGSRFSQEAFSSRPRARGGASAPVA